MSLHLEHHEIERRCLDNVAMYEGTRWPSTTTKALAAHWRQCLEDFRAYREGRLSLQDLPSDIREMGWSMPSWGTYGT